MALAGCTIQKRKGRDSRPDLCMVGEWKRCKQNVLDTEAKSSRVATVSRMCFLSPVTALNGIQNTVQSVKGTPIIIGESLA